MAYAMSAATGGQPASGKQTAFILRLISEREPAAVAGIRAMMSGPVTKAQASAAIEQLLAMPKVASGPKVDLEAIETGYYVRSAPSGEREVYVVVESKAGRKYAKQLVVSVFGHASWQYVRGAVYRLEGLSALSVEEAAKLGHLYGVCVVCARQLTDPVSVERGIGPVCAKRLHR